MPARIGVFDDVRERLAVGLVLPLSLFVLHDAALLIEPRLIDRA
jgi:hypothetical protein